METARDPRGMLVRGAGLAIGLVGIATIGVHAHLTPDGRAANDAFMVALCLSGAAVGFTRFRSSRDTHPLFVGAGLLAVAVQTIVFDQNWILSDSTQPWEAISLPAMGWFIGWIVAGIAFVLARPWWDRRGRRRIPAWVVLTVTAATLAVPDLMLIVFRHSLPHAKNVDLRRDAAFALTSPALWVVGLMAIALLGTAAWRESHPPGDIRTPRPWLAAAWLMAIGAQVAMLARPVAYRPLVIPADVLFPLCIAVVIVGFLAPQRSEASRARRATDRAQEIMGGRAEIAAMIAHEVRGPVSTVRGLAGTALSHYDRLDDDERRELLGLIEQESRRLLATVTQASTALKVDAGTVTYDIRPQGLGATVREGIATADVGQHPVKLDVMDEEFALDRKWIIEVVRQLVDNAAKFSPQDAPIHVNARIDSAGATIEVIDEGPGIPAEHRDDVFDKYPNWRPDGYEQEAGSGLGLFLVRGIVLAHRGDVRIVDAPGGGTMLRVRIPMEG
jgi:signal transduction histidine kinase